MISTDGIIIRIAADTISMFNRPSKGVRIMKFGANAEARVLSVATAAHNEEEVTDVPDAPDADAAEAPADEPEEAVEETVEE